jgi:hypothetical protein
MIWVLVQLPVVCLSWGPGRKQWALSKEAMERIKEGVCVCVCVSRKPVKMVELPGDDNSRDSATPLGLQGKGRD